MVPFAVFSRKATSPVFSPCTRARLLEIDRSAVYRQLPSACSNKGLHLPSSVVPLLLHGVHGAEVMTLSSANHNPNQHFPLTFFLFRTHMTEKPVLNKKEQDMLRRDLLGLYRDFVLLKNFAVINYTAVVKVMCWNCLVLIYPNIKVVVPKSFMDARLLRYRLDHKVVIDAFKIDVWAGAKELETIRWSLTTGCTGQLLHEYLDGSRVNASEVAVYVALICVRSDLHRNAVYSSRWASLV